MNASNNLIMIIKHHHQVNSVHFSQFTTRKREVQVCHELQFGTGVYLGPGVSNQAQKSHFAND